MILFFFILGSVGIYYYYLPPSEKSIVQNITIDTDVILTTGEFSDPELVKIDPVKSEQYVGKREKNCKGHKSC
ncbi:hypothetical protein IIC38_17565 [candidate division KSB1 bacterium]|nr:hypothetical protein [candidate division KSB1 bacterium]